MESAEHREEIEVIATEAETPRFATEESTGRDAIGEEGRIISLPEAARMLGTSYPTVHRLGRASAEEIARRSGLTRYQIARGMTELRDKDIIVPVVRKTADGYRKLDRSNYGHVAQYCITRDVWRDIELNEGR